MRQRRGPRRGTGREIEACKMMASFTRATCYIAGCTDAVGSTVRHLFPFYVFIKRNLALCVLLPRLWIVFKV